ncbi:hypothetical protein J6S55_03300 [Candidatus Saccharibacteria bacterium]|nr:hypothetical protein [Candidatus Saccharibacteria bacterium]
MKKTHKKILGFTGLGLVAAVTTVAAVMPSPIASAVMGVSDQISVYVTSTTEPTLLLTPSEGGTVTSPAYSLKVTYNKLYQMTGTIAKSGGGTSTFWSENVGGESGQKDFDLNFDTYGGYGDFVITVTGLDENNTPLERYLQISYENPSPEPGPEPGPDEPINPGDGGDVPVKPDIPTVEVASATVDIYDESGQNHLYGPINIDNPASTDSIDLTALPNGTYLMEVISRDANGTVIDRTTKIFTINRGGGGSTISEPIEPQDETIGRIDFTVKDEAGNVVLTDSLDNPTPGQTAPINVSNLPAGNYVMIMDYFNVAGEKINTTTKPFTITDGHVDPDIPGEVDVVETIDVTIYDEDGNIVRTLRVDRETGTVYVYDKDGNLLYTIPNGYEDGEFNIPFEGLEDGEYRAVITYRDGNGNLVGSATTYRVTYESGSAPVIVPDTGSFFEGLNMSRQDYLITGAIAFTAIGALAFGIIAKNRRNSLKK